MKKRVTGQSGFTLIELLLYMALLVILIMVMSQAFSSILDAQLESKSTSSVELDSKYIFAKLIHDMQLMQINIPATNNIITPSAPGIPSSTLNFTVNSINYIYSLNNGNLELNINGDINNLNSVDTTVSYLQFTRIGTGINTDTIRVNFTLTSKVIRKAGPETRSYQTTISSQ